MLVLEEWLTGGRKSLVVGRFPGTGRRNKTLPRRALLPASDILGNVTSQRQLESHALMGLHHANDLQYKRQQAQKAQQHYTDSETAPMTKATEPPTHAKGHAEHNS